MTYDERLNKAHDFEDLEVIIQEWQKEAFPEMNKPIHWLLKWEEEYHEYINTKTKEEALEEAADVIIVSYGLMMYDEKLGTFFFVNFMKNVTQLFGENYLAALGEAIKKKMLKNIKREWTFIKQEPIELGVYKGSH